MATPSWKTLKLRPEVLDVLSEVRVDLSRRGIMAIQDLRTRERAMLLEHLGPSDVVMLALALLQDHLRPEPQVSSGRPKLGRAKKRG